MKKIILILALFSVTTAFAMNNEWSSSADGTGGSWKISIGSKEKGNLNEIKGIADEKTAKKLAKKLNKVRKKDNKKGFMNDGSTNCDNPLIQC